MANLLWALRRGHWPSLIGAWLHFEVSFMTWLLIGSLGVSISEELSLSATQKGLLVACPLLSGALFRIVVGLSSDYLGPKTTGLYVLFCEVGALLWGWMGGGTFPQMVGIGFVLGVAGASFAVALPLASRAYPPAHQGLVMGLAASANSGTVLAMFFAPRLAEWVGWRGVFGVMLVPVLATAAVFALLVRRDDAASSREVFPNWRRKLEESLARPAMYWLCLLYSVTFGGFVGVCSALPIFLHDQYRLDLVTAGSITALGGLLGSVIRPLGGYVADRVGGALVLPAVLGAIAGSMVAVGSLPPLVPAVLCVMAAITAMGFGNGVLFQVVSDKFPKEIGMASGLIGAAGGVGGFLFPFGLGSLKDLTGTYAAGWWVFAAAAGCAWASVRLYNRRTTLQQRNG
ncbi:MAG TPA: MFS transporter, partial [Nitrospira sp.]|nr:MFS transporter [Nitrospira sp.]